MTDSTSTQQDTLPSSIIETLYDARAPSYDSTWHASFVKDVLALITDPPLAPGNRCIDLCCGTGLLTYLLAEHVAPTGHVYGIDVSKGMLDVARAKQHSAPAAHARCVHLVAHDAGADLAALPALAGQHDTFDLVTCASALVLLPDPAAAVAAWARWLKPGGAGRLVLDVPHPANMPHGVLLERVSRDMGVPMPFNRGWVEGPASLPQLLERTGGLAVERVEFVAQQGWGRRWYEASRAEAERLFREMLNGNVLVPWVQGLDAATRQRLEEAFCAAWQTSGNAGGKVEEVDGVWVAVARRV